jgi:primosomal protein N' (replication factor Y)
LAEETAELFPDARILVLSSDMPGGTERMRAELQAVAEHRFDIVIGTQLVAKGHNFPYLTLVGVVDADIGLSNGDPRAATERYARELARAACQPPEQDGWSVAAPGTLPGLEDIVVLGPAEAPIALLRGAHRFRLLFKAPRRCDMQGFLRQMLAKAPKALKGLRVAVDVDPQNFL